MTSTKQYEPPKGSNTGGKEMVQKEEKNEKPSHSKKMGVISRMKREREGSSFCP